MGLVGQQLESDPLGERRLLKLSDASCIKGKGEVSRNYKSTEQLQAFGINHIKQGLSGDILQMGRANAEQIGV